MFCVCFKLFKSWEGTDQEVLAGVKGEQKNEGSNSWWTEDCVESRARHPFIWFLVVKMVNKTANATHEKYITYTLSLIFFFSLNFIEMLNDTWNPTPSFENMFVRNYRNALGRLLSLGGAWIFKTTLRPWISGGHFLLWLDAM